MVLKLSPENKTCIEHCVYYFELTDYPRITSWEWESIIEFIKYEHIYGRTTEVVSEDESVRLTVSAAVNDPDNATNTLLSDKRPEWETSPFVYHATSLQAACKIFRSGSLLSAEKVYGKSAEELAYEKRDSLWNDPADFFMYVMLGWGNSPIGDYVVLSDNFPSEEELMNGTFDAGVRFFFKNEALLAHPKHILDGYHAIKVKDEIALDDYLFACIVPEQYKRKLEGFVPKTLSSRVHYLPQRGISLFEWNDRVCGYLAQL